MPAWALRVGSREVVLQPGEVVLGRAPGCDVVVDDPSVSRRHARIVVHADRLEVEDLGSAGGLLLNGAPARGLVTAMHGDRIQVGGTVLRVVSPTSDASPTVNDTGFKGSGEPTRPLQAVAALAAHADDLVSRNDPAAPRAVDELLTAVERWDKQESAHPDLVRSATRLALQLAESTNEQRWIDRLLEVLAIRARPLAASAVRHVRRFAEDRASFDPSALAAYLTAVRTQRGPANPHDRVLFEELERLATARSAPPPPASG